jgi:hypothetical protein
MRMAAPESETAPTSLPSDEVSMTPRADRGTRRRRRRSHHFTEASWVNPATGQTDSVIFRQAPAAFRLADRIRAQGIDVEIAVGVRLLDGDRVTACGPSCPCQCHAEPARALADRLEVERLARLDEAATGRYRSVAERRDAAAAHAVAELFGGGG